MGSDPTLSEFECFGAVSNHRRGSDPGSGSSWHSMCLAAHRAVQQEAVFGEFARKASQKEGWPAARPRRPSVGSPEVCEVRHF